MTSVVLPTSPGFVSMTHRLITTRTENRPATGSSESRFARMGSRYAFDFETEPLTPEEAMDWSIIETEAGTCVVTIPQVDFDTGAPGAPLVNGAGQSGTSLMLDGLTPRYVIRRGQWLNITTGGLIYLYRAAAEAIADGAGNVTVTLQTLLRAPHGNNDVVELGQPKVEGFVTLPDDAWSISGTERFYRLAFSIKERA